MADVLAQPGSHFFSSSLIVKVVYFILK